MGPNALWIGQGPSILPPLALLLGAASGLAYSPNVDAASELPQFLTSRRARVTPEQAGLPTYGLRRVPGLRREEVPLWPG